MTSVLPVHLVNQTYNMLLKEFFHIFTSINLYEFLNPVDVIHKSSKTISSIIFEKLITSDQKIKNIIVISDSALKFHYYLFLNNKESQQNLLKKQSDESIFIFDEFDIRLNFEISKKKLVFFVLNIGVINISLQP